MNEISRTLQFTADDGARHECTWSWNATDPLIVRLDFGYIRNYGQRIVWLIGREILDGGLKEPSGNGDVRTLSAGRKYYLRVSPPDGQASMEFFLGDVRNFLRETRRSVPVAAESAVVENAIDAEWQLLNLGGVS